MIVNAWYAPHLPLTELGRAPASGSGHTLSVLKALRTARMLHEEAFHQPLLSHDLQVMWLAYRLACACGAVSPHEGMDTLGELTPEQVLWAGLLHDVGKQAVPKAILEKPAPLTADETLIMRTHPMLGYQLAAHAAQQWDIREIDSVVLEAVLHHHERFDGEGYPIGLSGQSIPLLARILSVADVYAALTTHRPYREAWSHTRTVQYLLNHRGTRFDPNLVNHAVQILQHH